MPAEVHGQRRPWTTEMLFAPEGWLRYALRVRAESWSLLPIALALASAASAEEPSEPANTPEVGAHDRGSTLFAASAGVLALPFAEACPFTGAACEPGEVALGTGLHVYGRIYDFAVGAGFTYAGGLKTTEAAGAALLEREHSRSYLVLDGVFRYYPPPLGSFEWWVGGSIGAVVINDTWTTLADREPYSDVDLIGSQAMSLATEGFSAGLEVGGMWKFHDIWWVGTTLRYSNWLLPPEREMTPLGDLASLAGRVDVIEAGLQIGFELFL
jgi:hypothetical protein